MFLIIARAYRQNGKQKILGRLMKIHLEKSIKFDLETLGHDLYSYKNKIEMNYINKQLYCIKISKYYLGQ